MDSCEYLAEVSVGNCVNVKLNLQCFTKISGVNMSSCVCR